MLSENLIKGYLIELKAQEEMIRYGFDIAVPSYNASKYDLLVDTGTEILKLQIKKAIKKSLQVPSFTITCTTQNVRASTGNKHKYTAEEIDYFATVWKNKVYLIPVEETSTCKTIREDSVEYLAENILSQYKRISDEELYNQATSGKNYCKNCGCEIAQTSELCVSCYNLSQRQVERPSRDELKSLIRNLSFVQIAQKYSVTDRAIRKWCAAENLPTNKSVIATITDEDWEKL